MSRPVTPELVTAERLRTFEAKIVKLWEAGELPFLIHIGGGNELWLARYFEQTVRPGDWILCSHRAHFHALLAGMSEETVESAIRGGRSMFLFSREHNFLSSAILGGACGIAAGIAWALKEEGSKNRVHCFLGDGGCENGKLHEAAIFVEGNDLPCSFIVEDNDRQVDTTKAERHVDKVPGLETIFKCVTRYTYSPTFPHAGAATPFKIVFNPDIVEKHAQ